MIAASLDPIKNHRRKRNCILEALFTSILSICSSEGLEASLFWAHSIMEDPQALAALGDRFTWNQKFIFNSN